MIVFDEYKENTTNTNVVEQNCWYGGMRATEVILTEDTVVKVKQGGFLASYKNKDRLIDTLMTTLQPRNHIVKRANNNADIFITETAISIARDERKKKVAIGKDVDLQCLLVCKCSTITRY